MSRQSRFPSLLAAVKRSFGSHKGFKSKQTHSTRARRLGLECLEERKVLAASFLGHIGGPGRDSGLGTIPFLDSVGNSYISGIFAQTADFGPSLSSPTNPLTSAGGNDGFLAKYSPNGDLLWARRFGGSANEDLSGAAVDSTGNLYVNVTSFSSSVDLNGDYAPDFYSAGGYDSYVLNLDASTGATIWSKQIGGSGNQISEGIAVAADGKVYVVGNFQAKTDFDPGPGTAFLTPAGNGKNLSADGFVLTLDSAGKYFNAWQIGGNYADAVNQVIVQDGSLYLKGSFRGTVDFAPGTAVNNRSSAGNSDLFFASYSTSGSLLNWVQTIGNASEQDRSSYQLVSDIDSVYLTGGVQGSMDFDPGPGTAVLTSVGVSDAVVAKYAKSSGDVLWAKQFGGAGNDYATNSVIDAGMLYVGGGYVGNVDFNPDVLGGELSSALGSQDGFFLQLSASTGAYQQVWTMGGSGHDVTRPVGVIHSVDGHPTLYVSGGFEGTANFPTGGSLTSAGDFDVYRMALDLAPPAPAARLSNSTTSTSATDLALVSLVSDLDDTSSLTRKKRLK